MRVFSMRPASACTRSRSVARRTPRVLEQELEEVQVVRELALAVGEEDLPAEDARVADDALEEALEVARVGERLPGEEARMVRVGGRRGPARARASASGTPKKGVSHAARRRARSDGVVDGEEQRPELARLVGLEEAILLEERVGDARRAQRRPDRSALAPRAREDEHVVGVERLARRIATAAPGRSMRRQSRAIAPPSASRASPSERERVDAASPACRRRRRAPVRACRR